MPKNSKSRLPRTRRTAKEAYAERKAIAASVIKCLTRNPFVANSFSVGDYCDLNDGQRHGIIRMLGTLVEIVNAESGIPPLNRLQEGFEPKRDERIIALLEDGKPIAALHYKHGSSFMIDKMVTDKTALEATKRFKTAFSRTPMEELFAHFIHHIPHDGFTSTPRTNWGTSFMTRLKTRGVIKTMTEGNKPSHDYVLTDNARKLLPRLL